jgi:hypothetical protein
VDRYLSFCSFFSFGHCVVCPSWTYGLRLSLWYLQTLIKIIRQFDGTYLMSCNVPPLPLYVSDVLKWSTTSIVRSSVLQWSATSSVRIWYATSIFMYFILYMNHIRVQLLLLLLLSLLCGVITFCLSKSESCPFSLVHGLSPVRMFEMKHDDANQWSRKMVTVLSAIAGLFSL